MISAPDRLARRALLEVLAQAFLDNPMNVAIHGPDPRRRLRANRAGLRALVLDSGEHALTRVLRAEGRIAGGFVVLEPGGFPPAAPGFRRQIGCMLYQGIRAMDRWGQVNQILRLNHPEEPCWYLAVLGVAPWAQSRGWGRALVEALGQLAGQQPAPIYLEADRPQSVRFYQSLGFEIRAEVDVLGVRCVCLGRGFGGD
jgi:ribosomal protein S18 acetylase RimI-like enzyme